MTDKSETTPKPKAKRGRPKGKTTQPAPVVVVDASRCPRCDSTKRTKYANTRTMDYGGMKDGKSYQKIIWRHCWCEECGQARIDKTYE